MSEDDDFRLGILLDPDSSKKLLELTEVAHEAPLKIMTSAIHTMWRSLKENV